MEKANLHFDIQITNLINNMTLDIELNEISLFHTKFQYLEMLSACIDFTKLEDGLKDKYKKIKKYYKQNYS